MTTAQNTQPPKRARVISLAVGGPYVGVQTVVSLFVLLFVDGDRPIDMRMFSAILGLPLLAWVVGVGLVFSVPRWRWHSLALSALVIAAVPWSLYPYRFHAHWPVSGSVPADSAHCPKPWVDQMGAGLPDYRNRFTYQAYAGSAGGIPPGFTPVTATRCLITQVNRQTQTALVTEQTVNGGLDMLVTALRRPAEVCHGHSSASYWAPTPAPNYLIMTDATGHSFVVGLPTNGCGTPHPDAVAAFNALPWRTTNGTTTP